jgi:hypothetical protein
MDLTNWEFGKTTVNILMISLICRGYRHSIDVDASSKCRELEHASTDLLDRLREAMPDMKVASLMGDQEWIGDAWRAYLCKENIPFVLRLRENQYVLRDGYAT